MLNESAIVTLQTILDLSLGAASQDRCCDRLRTEGQGVAFQKGIVR
jgi:hypothetical protein